MAGARIDLPDIVAAQLARGWAVVSVDYALAPVHRFPEPVRDADLAVRWVRRHAGSVDLVAGVEARGFVVGAALAHALGVGFVPVRKAGKLPGQTVSISYDLEYGSAEIEVHADAFVGGERVLLVDDVLATGGTASAAWDLLEQVGADVVGFECVVELAFLGGRGRMGSRRVGALLVVP